MKVLKIIVSITIPFFLIILFASILTTTPYLIFSKGLYESHSRIEFDHDYAAERIMGYLNYRYEDLNFGTDEFDDSILLRDEEIVHMEDVLKVYTGLRIAAFSSLIIGVSLSFLIYKRNKEELYKTFKHMYIGPALFVLFLGGYILIDFNAAFTAFHNIFFPQGGWTLGYNDALIQLLPTPFWMVSGIIILVLFSLSMALIYVLNEKVLKKKLLN